MAGLDEKYIYVFVRQDLPLAQQIVQSGHALWESGFRYGDGVVKEVGHPYLVLIGVPDTRAMDRVLVKLKNNSIEHVVWVDSEVDLNATAVSTYPLSRQEKDALKSYRLWNASLNAAEDNTERVDRQSS